MKHTLLDIHNRFRLSKKKKKNLFLRMPISYLHNDLFYIKVMYTLKDTESRKGFRHMCFSNH